VAPSAGPRAKSSATSSRAGVMALPPLTEEGELPLRVHRASPREVRERSLGRQYCSGDRLPGAVRGIRIVRHEQAGVRSVRILGRTHRRYTDPKEAR
jgi:hypothetical protein